MRSFPPIFMRKFIRLTIELDPMDEIGLKSNTKQPSPIR